MCSPFPCSSGSRGQQWELLARGKGGGAGIGGQHPASFTTRSRMLVVGFLLLPSTPRSAWHWFWLFLVHAIPGSSLVYNSTLCPHLLQHTQYILHIQDICCSFCFAFKLILSDFQGYIPWQHWQFVYSTVYSLCGHPRAVRSRPLLPSFDCSPPLRIIILGSEIVHSTQNNRLLLLPATEMQ